MNRGGLKCPAVPGIAFVSYCHSVFECLTAEKLTCRNHLIQVFQIVDDVFDTNIQEEGIFRKLANVFMNNFCKNTNIQKFGKRKFDKLN